MNCKRVGARERRKGDSRRRRGGAFIEKVD